MAMQCFPYAEDPPPQYGIFRPDHLYQVRRIRDRLLERLAQHGQVTALERLALRCEHEADREIVRGYQRSAQGGS